GSRWRGPPLERQPFTAPRKRFSASCADRRGFSSCDDPLTERRFPRDQDWIERWLRRLKRNPRRMSCAPGELPSQGVPGMEVPQPQPAAARRFLAMRRSGLTHMCCPTAIRIPNVRGAPHEYHAIITPVPPLQEPSSKEFETQAVPPSPAAASGTA